MQNETTIGAVEEFARWDNVTELQLHPYDLDVVASTITHGPEEVRCDQTYCPERYCAQGYSSK
jgi:hypothetical protein